MENVKQKESNAFVSMQKQFGYKNKLAAPRLTKIVVSVGTGTLMKKDRHKNDFVADRLAKITGQKPAIKSAKQSVSSFKIRAGDPIGVMVTLRGERMYSFLDKLIDIALPRTKDFRGISESIVDNMGNATLSVKEHSIFPEAAEEELKDVFGMGITMVTTAKTREEAVVFFNLLGIPFKKD